MYALIACITVGMVAIPKQMTQGESVNSNFFEEAREGYRTLKESKGLFALLWIGALYVFVFMPINALFPLMSMSYFGGTATYASIVEIFFAVGMLVGGLLLGVWGGFKKRALSIIFSISLMGITLFISGLLPINGFLIFVLCSALMGFSSPFYSGVQMALIQEKIQPEYLGRVFGLLGSITSFAMPIGLIISGIFADQIGINMWFMLSGVCIIGIAILCVLLPSIRNLDK